MPSRSTVATIILGSFTLVSILGTLYYFFQIRPKALPKSSPFINKSKGNKSSKESEKAVVVEEEDEQEEEGDEEEEDIDETEEEVEALAHELTNESIPSNSSPDNAEIELLAKEAELRAQELKAQYDDAVRLARKLLEGQAYVRAAAKYSEALELSTQIPSASKDILTLYNNRSAMYEKAGEYQKSLNDITVVLAMDSRHLKARLRRARILEVLGKYRDSLYDYVFGMLLEQTSGQAPSVMQKVDELAKILAREDAIKIVTEMRNSPGRNLPPKSYCRSFFDSLPSLSIWKEKYQDAKRDDYASAFEKAVSDGTNLDEIISTGLELIYFYIVHGFFNRAFEDILTKIPITDINQSAENLNANNLSIFWELRGTNQHLRCSLSKAVEYYQAAIRYNPNNFEASLKLAAVHLELGEILEADAIYNSVLESLATGNNDPATKAWILIHYTSRWTTKGENGKFQEGALENASKYLNEALSLTDDLYVSDKVARAARVAATTKLVQAIPHIKAQTGEAPDLEDQNRNKKYIEEVKLLDPHNETMALMEADMAALEGNIDLSLNLISKVQENSDADDGIPHVIRANILTQKAFHEMSSGNMLLMQQAQESLNQCRASYEEALRVEPNSVEALAQYAQLKQMLGDPKGGVELAEKALKYGRSRDEVQEMCQLYIMAKTQASAFEELQASSR